MAGKAKTALSPFMENAAQLSFGGIGSPQLAASSEQRNCFV